MDNMYIYALRSNDDGSIAYVGKTNNPKVRLKRHRFGNSRRDNARLFDWILVEGKPLMTILSVCTPATWDETEQAWIAYLRSVGVDLLNIAIGGAGPNIGQVRSMSEEVRQRLKDVRDQQLACPEYRERHKAGVRRWYSDLTQDQREHLAEVGRKELAKHATSEKQSARSKAHWDSLSGPEREKFIQQRTKVFDQKHTKADRQRNARKNWERMTAEEREIKLGKLHDGLKARWARYREGKA